VSYYVTDQPVMDHFLGWTGPIGSDLRRRGRTLEFRARSSAGFRTGKLRLDIETRERTVVDGLQIEVGNWHVRYAAAQHQGARPHIIVPRKPGGRLVFQVAGKTVFAKRVNHPGNPANPYLARWLNEAVR
jgi:hypothetical protein